MTTLEAAISRILPAALAYPGDATVALGTVLGLLAQREADPAEAIRTAMRTAAATLPARAPETEVVPIQAWRP